jgi:4-hydroxybenzoate polyprenyltransferase
MSAAPPRENVPFTIPLCVDLDGTIIKSDLLIESFFALVKSNPLFLLLVPVWLLRGKAYLKEQIARRVDLDLTGLPYRDSVLNLMRTEKTRGRPVILVTSAHSKYAQAVAGHLGLFDRVLATEGSVNLSGERKLAALRSQYPERGFDYAGNAKADLPIWRHARKAIVVNASARVTRQAKRDANVDAILQDRSNYFSALARALRVHHWAKNLLVFVPLIVSHRIFQWDLDLKALVALGTFCGCASSVYVLNDLLDLPVDRLHPRKRERPFSAGTVPLVHGMVLSPLLLAVSILAAFIWLPDLFVGVLGIYYVTTLIYSFWGKSRVLVDVLLLAGLYTVRILAGAAAVHVVPSFWLLAFSTFLFLSLALVKRYSEMLVMTEVGRKKAGGRGYTVSDMPLLESLGAASGYVSVLVLALYINSSDVLAIYSTPMVLWMLCPLLLFWISRVWLLAHRGEMHDDPVVFALKDNPSRAVAVLVVLTMLVGAAV